MFTELYRRVFANSNRSRHSLKNGRRRNTRLCLEPLEVRAVPAVITVTGTGDTIAADGFVTLREAITAANTNAASGDAAAGDAGLDTIQFNIAGAPGTVHTIQPMSALPTITESIFIDGYSQLGASPNTLVNGDNAFLAIELDGSLVNFQAGLVLSGSNSTVQGLVINRFGNEGILVIGASGNVIRGNFLGTDPTGKLDQGNGISGVSVLSSNNIIGGTAPADRNIISGNDFTGIAVLNQGISGNQILGNFIGTDDTGLADLGNNVAGVRILNVQGNTVGGTQAGAGNVIAFNSGDGIQVSNDAGLGNAFLGNSIHSNDGLGIDLNNDGPTPNDPLDADAGPNGLQNTPVLGTVTTNGSVVTITGTLQSTASSSFRVEFFTNASADPAGFGEGQTFLGFANVTTDASGNGSFAFSTSTAVPVGTLISATATNAAGSTSEFSQLASVVTPNTATLSGATLSVTGTGGGDVILIEPRPGFPAQIRVKANGKSLGAFNKSDVGRIFASGLGGHDTIIVNASLNIPAELHGNTGNDQLFGSHASDRLFGEAGNDFLFSLGGSDVLDGGTGSDRLEGGGGSDLLLGGGANDKLFGQGGRDVLIGGFGSDDLNGGAEDDIVIGGVTDHDANLEALLLILGEWTSSAAIGTRIDNLMFGGGLNDPFLLTPGDTVNSDGVVDRLTGEAGLDWFFRSLADGDKLLDLNAGKDRVAKF